MAIPALKQPAPPNIRFWLAGIITITFIAALAVLSIFILHGENTDLVTVPTLVGLPVAWAESDPNTKIEDRFKVRFVNNHYAIRRNHRIAIESLQLNCAVAILDPNLVIGMPLEGTITQFENDKGEIVDVPDQTQPTSMPQRETPDIPSSVRTYFSGYRYQYRSIPQYRSTSFVRSRWAKQSALRLPRWINVFKPARITFELEQGLRRPEPKKINRVKGHFHVLMAESLEYIEIPFEPNETWVQLAPDFEIKLLEAQATESNHKYRIEVCYGGRDIKGSIYPWSDLPNRLPIDRQYLDKDGKPVFSSHMSRFSLGDIGGGGSIGGSSIRHIEKIRYVIAVNASHHKIPFELEDIPLSPRNLLKMFQGQPLPDYHPDIEKNDIWKRQPKPFEKIVSWKPQPLSNFRIGHMGK